MYTAYFFLSLWLCRFTAGTTFNKINQGITDITNHPIPAGTTQVKFQENSISRVPEGYFENLPSLDSINLYSNLISDIDDYAFVAVATVTWLNLAENKLEIIREQMFSGLTNLRVLYLQYNLVQRIEPGSFRDNTALTTLYLSYNLLQTLPESMFDLDNHPNNLQHDGLYMYNNPLVCNQSICWLKQAEQDWILLSRPDLIVCTGPGDLIGRTWDNITTHDLNCHAGKSHELR